MSSRTVNTLLAGAVLATVGALASTGAAAMDADKEKCYGVVKAGHNDCANAAKTHSCAGYAATDADGGEWLALPKGVCDKLAGGSLEPIEAAAAPAAAEEEAHGDQH